MVDKDSFSVLWRTDDILDLAAHRGIKITREEARNMMSEIIRKHDASIGINWDVLNTYLDDFVS